MSGALWQPDQVYPLDNTQLKKTGIGKTNAIAIPSQTLTHRGPAAAGPQCPGNFTVTVTLDRAYCKLTSATESSV